MILIDAYINSFDLHLSARKKTRNKSQRINDLPHISSASPICAHLYKFRLHVIYIEEIRENICKKGPNGEIFQNYFFAPKLITRSWGINMSNFFDKMSLIFWLPWLQNHLVCIRKGHNFSISTPKSLSSLIIINVWRCW